MWGGHSCPPPLILILTLRMQQQNQDQDQKRRTGVSAPHQNENGAAPVRNPAFQLYPQMRDG